MICNVVRPVGVWGPCFPLPSTQLAVGLGSSELLPIAKLPWRGPTTVVIILMRAEFPRSSALCKVVQTLQERGSYIHTYIHTDIVIENQINALSK